MQNKETDRRVRSFIWLGTEANFPAREAEAPERGRDRIC
jgi:hypothetical protein